MAPVPTPARKHPIITPITNLARPQLPLQCQNPLLKNLDSATLPPVKFQQIQRPQKTVTVGRMKVQTPSNGHAFILRRYDTGAVSITTLFRAAFPNASEQAEKEEIAWVSHNYDLQGANGGRDENRVRFSGRWAPVDVALMLSDDYGLGHVLPVLVAAEPPASPTKGASAVPPTPAKAAAAASPEKKAPAGPIGSPAGPPPAKRRKEASPAPSPARPAAAVAPTPARALRVQSPDPAPTPVALRRSARQATRSPSPGPKVFPRSARKPPSERPLAPIMSDETMVGEEDAASAEEQLKPKMAEDIAEQRELIARLKAERDAELAAAEAAAAAVEPAAGEVVASQAVPEPVKRPREEEEETLRFEFKEPETEERAIVSNSRARVGGRLPPERKSALWGSLAFAVGLGAATFLPNIAALSSFF